ncbi:MAG: acyl-[ACP]--phospholipid O-acyltransferase [Planctomycetota bacterium]|nr:acyl-[ACP]--phospholipid O-acyltransferase [Planctomycetota bacterium]MDA0921462.1 acyl-[ACP]--phospholipid O-acyltransferase [Planctomycetota bacterium]
MTVQETSLDAVDLRGGLGSRSYLGILFTQMLGALNDNMFRFFAVCVAKPVLGNETALAIGAAVFTVPYLLLAVPAGFFADRFSKRSVIVNCKIAEIAIMILGVLAIMSGNIWLLVAVVAFMGGQSALFSPAKYGAIPETVTHEHLSTANGAMGLVTVGASAIGTALGYWLAEAAAPDITNPTWESLQIPAMLLVGVAFVGLFTSLVIERLPAADKNRKLELNFVVATVRDLRFLKSSRPLFRTALGIAFFWMLASLAQMNIDPFAEHVLGLKQSTIGLLMAVLVLGLGGGSVFAGIVSGGKVELGLVPLGACGITVSAILLFVSGYLVDPLLPAVGQPAFVWSCVWLFLLGFSAGLFDIPLEANLQHRSDTATRGTILAATNFLTFAFILVAAGLFYVMGNILDMDAGSIFLVCGLGTIPVIVYAFQMLPQATIRFVVWMFSHLFYRIKVVGKEHVPKEGGGLLVCNHVSWLDGVLLIMMSDRPIRMLAYADYVDVPGFVGWISRTYGTIPIKADGGPKALLRSLKEARKAAEDGDLVCIFAEGALTRTGQLFPFQRGLLRIVEGTSVPVIPTYLDELWGSIFSYHGGKFFWKWPRRWPYPFTIMFGEPLHDANDVRHVRQAVEELGVQAVTHRKSALIPARQFLRASRKARFRSKVADSAGADITGGKLLTGALAFRRVLERSVLAHDEQMVGVLLPPSAGGAIVNATLSLMGKVAVNLNYTLSDEVLNFCIKEAGIKHVITSQKFLEKKPMKLDAEVVFAEDLKTQITGVDKLASLVSAFAEPICLLERRLGLTKIDPDSIMTIIFTSGSTGEPKGVMLSHRNVGSNIASANQLYQINKNDALLGILPFFHSFGYSLMLWLPLTLDPKGVYHFNPLDGRMVGKLCEQHKITIIAATPTFLKTYLKRCTKEQMATMDVAIVGAEKLPQQLADEFHEKFGIWPTEGYGTTELSPLAAANVPDHRSNATLPEQSGSKMGTIGRPIPNVMARIVDLDSGEELPQGEAGLMHIRGPNVMLGYLNRPEKTAEVIKDGWYNTGDIAFIDDEGFITITGRLSRFSKIGGEMVPHIRIEEEINKLVDDPDAEEATIRIAVTAVPHEQKGERIIVLHRELNKSVDEILKALSAAGMPNLWLPSADSFLLVDEIPLLGTGKLDLQGVKQRAMDEFGPKESA